MSGKGRVYPPLASRLAAATRKEASGCWVFTGSKTSFGYGYIKQAKALGGKNVYAHRAAWEIANGPIPPAPEVLVLHKCDNPSCVNPDHLFLGDHQVNVDDMLAKGRWSPPRQDGERNNNAKLTETQVRAIRSDTRKLSEIAADYGIGQSTASLIRSRKLWPHVD